MEFVESMETTADEILQSLHSPFSLKELGDNPLECLHWFCEVFEKSRTDVNEETRSNTMRLLECLPSICSPKELFLALLEEIDRFKSHETFLALIGPIQKCLILLSDKHYKYVTMAYETLCSHIESEPLAESSTECSETLNSTTKNFQSIEALSVFLNHFAYFVKKINSEKMYQDSDHKKYVQDFSLILLRVFARPLVFLPLCNQSESCEQVCLTYFEMLQVNAVKFILSTLDWKKQCDNLKSRKEKSSGEMGESDYSELIHWDVEAGCGVLAYLLFNENYMGNLVPQVFSKSYIFQSLMPIISHLIKMRHGDFHPVDKGCTLIINTVKLIKEEGLDAGISDCDNFRDLVKNLLDIVAICPVKELVQKIVLCLKMMLLALKGTDRLNFLFYILHTTSYSGIQSYAISALKDQFCQSVKNGDNLFNNGYLKKLVDFVFVLIPPNGEVSKSKDFKETKKHINVFDHMDRLMASLNFLILLLIRLAHKNASSRASSEALASSAAAKVSTDYIDISPYIQCIAQNFLEPLKEQVKTRKFECHTELNRLKDNGDEGDSDLMKGMVVNNKNLGGMTMHDRIKAAEMMLTNLDLLESNLKRIDEMILDPNQADVLVCNAKYVKPPPEVYASKTAHLQANMSVL